MKRTTKIAVAVGTVLSLGLAAAVVGAQPYGMGWGGGPGYGMGYGMHGYAMGPGYGMGPGHGMGWSGGPGYGMHGYGMGPGFGMGPGYGRGMFNADPGAVEEGFTGLKSELAITDKQETAWQAFVNNAKKQTENRQAWFEKMREARAAGSAPELLAQQTEIMKQRQAELESSATALKNLYAVLTPEQKAIADQRFGGFGPGYQAQGYRRGPGGRFR